MRRKEKEIKDINKIEEIIKNNNICRLGFCDGEMPYVIGMNYGYKDRYFYFHTPNEGKKIDLIKKNNNVCIEIEENVAILESELPCNWGTKYKSVVGFGKIEILSDWNSIKEGLDILMSQFTDKYIGFQYNEKMLGAICILRLHIENISGKKSGGD